MGLGLDQEAAEELALAAEEVMAYLVRIGSPGSEVEVRCLAGSHYVKVDFSFPLKDLELRAFNITTVLNLDDEAALDDMGLLIASRLSDRFRIALHPNGNPELSLIKEFTYPEIAEEARETSKPLSHFSLQEPDQGQIKWFLRLVNHSYAASTFPRDFLYPGKIVDMAAAGDYGLLLADRAKRGDRRRYCLEMGRIKNRRALWPLYLSS